MVLRSVFLAVIGVLGLCMPHAVSAADSDGNFSIKGAGLQSCTAFQEAFDSASPDLGVYVGWVEGYVTANNQTTDGVFDLVPWQDNNTVLRLLYLSCSAAPDETNIIAATTRMLRGLYPARLPEASEAVGYRRGDNVVVLFEEILRRAKLRLAELEYDLDPQEPGLTEQAELAFEAFQADQGIAVTGLPDQATLIRLFFE